MSHIRNYIVLDQDPDEVLVRFRDHQDNVKRQIVDPATGQAKTVTVLELIAEWADGEPTDARYSVTSDREYQLWRPLLASKGYLGKTYRIRKVGKGFRRETSLEVVG